MNSTIFRDYTTCKEVSLRKMKSISDHSERMVLKDSKGRNVLEIRLDRGIVFYSYFEKSLRR